MSKPVVTVIDDDVSMRGAVEGLFRSVGLGVQAYASAEDYLSQADLTVPGCLVLDVRMPGMSGLELQEKLELENARTPIVFITAHEDLSTRLQAMQAGAVAFLLKPFDDRALLDAVYSALGR